MAQAATGWEQEHEAFYRIADAASDRLLGGIALKLGRKLRWDPVAEQFVGDDGANRMLTRPCRAPWRW